MNSKAVMSITDAAAHHVMHLLSKRNKPSLGIRVGIKTGGCSGLKYFIEYADEKQQFDETIHDKGVTVLIDPKALMYLLGTTMDYVEEEFKAGFVFINPNEKAKCGCGSSFNI